MNARKKYRMLVCCFLILSLLGLGYVSWAAVCSSIPDRLLVARTGELPELFPYPLNLLIEESVTADAGTKKNTADTGAKEEKTAARKNMGTENEVFEGKNAGTDADMAAGESDKVVQAVEQKSGGRYREAGSAVHGAEASSAAAASEETYEISYSLLGKIPLKTVSASVVEPATVYAGGSPIGIYLRTDGVLVVGTGVIRAADGSKQCPAENIVKCGDYIKAANGETVSTKEEFVACVGKSGGSDIVLDVEREGEDIELKISPIADENGIYRAGIWVRNDTQGIGTLTYVDEDGHFGALGHGISDVDTGELMEIEDGTLYDAEVISIVKGRQGSPGELAGVIHYSEGYKIGVIEENNQNGLYGTISGFPMLAEQMSRYEVAYRQSVETGPAAILCSVDGICREYSVEIEEIRLNGKDINKGMVLRVTDPELLELTGGIVQGMSGSPIIQNGCIVGAVTHVFVNDPTKGYGIFIENMLEH